MKKLTLLALAAILLIGCQPAATPQPTVSPPTDIPVTQPPAPTPTSAPIEALASSVNDVVGIWIFTVKVEFKANKTVRIYFGSDTNPDLIDEGSYSFDAGKITWTTTNACKDKPATYEAYVTRQDGKPTWLRLQVVGSDPCTDRADILQRPGKFHAPSISTSVEALAGSIKDLAGVWWATQCPCKIEFKLDGTYRVWDSFSGTQAEGSFTLDNGKITWVTSQPTCNDQPATYEAYITKLDGKPVQLRLVVVGSDPCSARAENTKGIAKFLSP